MNAPSFDDMMAGAGNRRDFATIAFAGVISRASRRPRPYNVPIAGLPRDEFEELLADRFPAFDPRALVAGMPADGWGGQAREDEFADLVTLLDDHASIATEVARWTACTIATACMAENHLWQDLGLPDRSTLSALMATYFTALYLRNTGNMKWKKFFYRELCRREEVLICKSPSCGECVDYAKCFGPEEPVVIAGSVATGQRADC